MRCLVQSLRHSSNQAYLISRAAKCEQAPTPICNSISQPRLSSAKITQQAATASGLVVGRGDRRSPRASPTQVSAKTVHEQPAAHQQHRNRPQLRIALYRAAGGCREAGRVRSSCPSWRGRNPSICCHAVASAALRAHVAGPCPARAGPQILSATTSHAASLSPTNPGSTPSADPRNRCSRHPSPSNHPKADARLLRCTTGH